METGAKLKKAREKQNISQKSAADSVGVSRQTLSSWENGKTYPDIESLINLSELYGVSLDELLKEKEEDKTSDYVAYIDKAIAAIKNHQRIVKWVEIGVYLAVLALFVILYHLNGTSLSRQQITLATHTFLIPCVIVIISLFIGIDDIWGSKRWFLILFFGLSFFLAEQFTITLDSTNGFNTDFLLSFLNIGGWATGAFLSFVGLGIGALARKFNTEDKL